MRNDNRRKINEKEPNFSPVVRALIRGTMTWGFKPDLLNSFGFFKWLSKLKLKFLGAGKRTGNRKLKKKKQKKTCVYGSPAHRKYWKLSNKQRKKYFKTFNPPKFREAGGNFKSQPKHATRLWEAANTVICRSCAHLFRDEGKWQVKDSTWWEGREMRFSKENSWKHNDLQFR